MHLFEIPGRAARPARGRRLLIVRRDQEALYRYLVNSFRTVEGVEVILDRRGEAGILVLAQAAADRRRAAGDFDVFGVRLVRG